jgi:hypothetical protein
MISLLACTMGDAVADAAAAGVAVETGADGAEEVAAEFAAWVAPAMLVAGVLEQLASSIAAKRTQTRERPLKASF